MNRIRSHSRLPTYVTAVIAVVVVVGASSPANAATRPWSDCSKAQGQIASRSARVPRAMDADPTLRRVFLDTKPSTIYRRPSTSLCGDFDGDGRTDRALLYQCCTVSSPAPWVVLRGLRGGWRIAYKRLSDTTFQLQSDGTRLITTEPRYSQSDALCCPTRLRIGTLRWNGARFVRTFRREYTQDQ
ncbi:MAG: hypothetical protein JWM31_1511 [Solirubrobacterales bacterium]|nr:hypothetical protein [Solirubrobacterales bacterium]